VLGGAATAGVAVLTAANHPAETAGLAALGRALTVAIPIAIGLYAWARDRGGRFGPLLTLLGGLWALTTLAESGNSTVYSTGRVFGWVFEVALVYLILAVPTGRLTARVDRWLVAGVAVLVGLLFMPTALLVESFPEPSPYGGCDTGCPPNAFQAVGTEPAFVDSVVLPVRELLSALLMLAVALRLAQRVRRASPALRRTLAPVLVVAASRCCVLVLAFVVRAVTSPSSPALDAVLWLFAAALPLMAIAFLLGDLYSRLFVADALQRLGTRIGSAPSSGALRSAVAEILDDPSVEIAYRAHGKGWVDADGSEFRLPPEGFGRCVTEISHEGQRVAALIHDEALADETNLVEAVGDYALVALENQRLMNRVAASTRELRESRARIVASADRERRRIERDLHDGAQQRLVALRIQLELMSETLELDPQQARRRLHSLGDDVENTLDSIRSLAHGVYPPLLEDRGLEGALRAAAIDVPIPATVVPNGNDRYPPEIESAVYFCCLEAMQNASKHAEGAERITISFAQGEGLRFEVRDDGCGFDATGSPDGAGLTNMRDRLAALGGDFEVTSSPGEGTTVAGSVPVRVLG